MKHKTLKRVLCFLLALVVVASMPLDIHANAVAVAPWAVYALITYMAAVGITFTVTGGVDAMVKAVQDKVDEYEQTVSLPLPIWVVIEEGTKLVPPPSGGGPNWNPNRGKFFFTANATAAITAFITWLVSDGGWSEGQHDIIQTTSTFTANYNGVNTVIATTSGIIPVSGKSYVYTYDNLGFYIPVDRNNLESDARVLTQSVFNYYGNYPPYSDNQLSYFYGLARYSNSINDSLDVHFYYGSSNVSNANRSPVLENILGYSKPLLQHIKGVTFGYDNNNNLSLFLLTVDDYLVWLDVMPTPTDIINLNTTVEIMTPEEIPQLQPSTQQGVYIDTSTDAETLEDLAEDIKTQFEETGTIPRPVPEVITDPDYAPQPSPELPTPETPIYPDVEGLGLPALGTLLMTKWPFCIPHDIARVINIFNAPRQTPVWEVNLYEVLGDRVPFIGDTTLHIDLTEYEAIGTITRWITLIGWCLTLLLITKQVQDW